MGTIYGLSRIWDAVSDPIAGYLSDRTRSRLGRRRSWLLASVLPISVGFAMTWLPPNSLGTAGVTVWVAIGVFVYYTGTTIFSIPHESLGAELTTDHHDRTRVFGVKTALGMLGSLLAVAGLWLFIRSDEPRQVALMLAVAGTGAVDARDLLRGDAGARAFPTTRAAVPPIWSRRFATCSPTRTRCPLLITFFIENLGTASLAVMTPFVMEYVLDMKDQTAFFIGVYFVPALLGIPVWIRLSRRVGKRKLWLFSVAMLALAFSGLFLVDSRVRAWLVFTLGTLAGVGGGCGQVVGPSIQADIIDWDELRTGERKEGAYFAVWNFMRKSAYGISAMASGWLLGAVDFVPNAVQSEATQLGMRALWGLLPGTCYALGFLALRRLRLDEAEHAAIRRELDARALRAARRTPAMR